MTSSIADSNAVLLRDRSLPQHQAAVTLLQGMLSNPEQERIRWLDLACGKGQIIAHLEDALTPRLRTKLCFLGYDIDNRFTQSARQIADSLQLAETQFAVGALHTFHNLRETQGPWDFISLTNTIHEIRPQSLASLFVESLSRLADEGCLFVYDMDRLTTLELGAVLWTGQEIRQILTTLCAELGCVDYEPPVSTWAHKTCDGWHVQIRRNYARFPEDWQDRQPAAIAKTVTCIETLLSEKQSRVRTALEALTLYGSETGGESTDKVTLLHDFWALARALESK